MFHEVYSMFFSFGSLEEFFRVFIPMSATSWELRGGPYSSISHDYSCWKFSVGKSGQPSLPGTGGGLCVKLNIVPVFMVVSVLVYIGYLVPACQKRGREESEIYVF